MSPGIKSPADRVTRSPGTTSLMSTMVAAPSRRTLVVAVTKVAMRLCRAQLHSSSHRRSDTAAASSTCAQHPFLHHASDKEQMLRIMGLLCNCLCLSMSLWWEGRWDTRQVMELTILRAKVGYEEFGGQTVKMATTSMRPLKGSTVSGNQGERAGWLALTHSVLAKSGQALCCLARSQTCTHAMRFISLLYME